MHWTLYPHPSRLDVPVLLVLHAPISFTLFSSESNWRTNITMGPVVCEPFLTRFLVPYPPNYEEYNREPFSTINSVGTQFIQKLFQGLNPL